jgi:hypothetical protein
MKKVALVALFAFVLVGIAFAQGFTTNPVAGVKEKSIDAFGNTIPQARYGGSLYNNNAVTAWWGGGLTTGYVNLDWGVLPDSDGLPEEIVDGFNFKYGTNNMDPAGDDYATLFFDGSTGWGNIGIQEAGFLFTGLPNGYGLPPLPPGYGWIWSVTVDLEGSGYEFLEGKDGRHGFCLNRMASPTMGGSGPAIGSPANVGGNGPTGTEDAFDIYFPDGTYNGTWYFGGYPFWATWPGELFGPQGPAAAMTYYGIGSTGNILSFYSTGNWAAGQNVHFMLRRYTETNPAWVLASAQGISQYIPTLDITKLVGAFVGGTPKLMGAIYAGDFDVLDVTIPNAAGGMRIYTQGAITQLSPIPPVEASNGIYSN